MSRARSLALVKFAAMMRKPQTDVISEEREREEERRFLYDDGSAVNSARSGEEKRAPERDATATCETLIKPCSSCILRCHVMRQTISQNLSILIGSLTNR